MLDLSLPERQTAHGLAPASLVRSGLTPLPLNLLTVGRLHWVPPLNWCTLLSTDWNAAGGGLTLGVSKAETVMVLNTDAAVQQFERNADFKLGAGLSVDCECACCAPWCLWLQSDGMEGALQAALTSTLWAAQVLHQQPAPVADIKPNEAANSVTGDALAAKMSTGETDAFVFTFASGLLFDLTVTAGMTTPAAGQNRKVYGGQSVTPGQVMRSYVAVKAKQASQHRLLKVS